MAIFSPLCLRLCRVVRVMSGITIVLTQAFSKQSICFAVGLLQSGLHWPRCAPVRGNGTPIVLMGGLEVNCRCYRSVTGVTADAPAWGLRRGARSTAQLQASVSFG